MTLGLDMQILIVTLPKYCLQDRPLPLMGVSI